LLRERVGSSQPKLSEVTIHVVLSDDTKSALEEALRDALERKRRGIEATDLLLGLVRKPVLGSTQILEDLDVSSGRKRGARKTALRARRLIGAASKSRLSGIA
jgi:hypothetical protein